MSADTWVALLAALATVSIRAPVAEARPTHGVIQPIPAGVELDGREYDPIPLAAPGTTATTSALDTVAWSSVG